MKKITKLFALAVSFVALSLTACSNLVDDATIEGDSIKAKTERTLTVFATGSTDRVIFPEESSGRTILPAALQESNLSFYIWGTNLLDTNDTSVNTPEKVDFVATAGTNGREGTVELDLPVSQYTLYLAAVDKNKLATKNASVDDVKKLAALYATATADMRYNEKVSFYLTPYFDNGNTGKGEVDLTIYTLWNLDEKYKGKVSFGMYNLTNDNIIKAKVGDTADQPAKVILSNNDQWGYFNNPQSGTIGTHYKVTEVEPGTYNFKVIFGDDSTNPNAKKYVWSDLIYVLPNQKTEKTIAIDDLIGVPAIAPTNFTARFAEAENTICDTYDVQFVWEDKSNNEQYFQIDLTEVADTFTGTTYSTPALWTTKTTYKNDSTEEIVDGSLAANSTMVVLKLKLGTRYIARLSAYNDAGVPDANYTYMDLTKTSPVAVEYNRLSTTITADKLTSFDSNTINRFRVTYNLNGGRYLKSTYTDTNNTKNITPVTPAVSATQLIITTLNGLLNADVRYYTQKETGGNEILNPLLVKSAVTGSSDEYALFCDGKQFSNWKLNDINGKTVWKITDDTAQNATKPWKKITGTGDSTVAAYYVSTTEDSEDFKYKGYKNLNLFATYDASAKVVIYDPADYQIKDTDVYVGTTTAINGVYGDATQVTLGTGKNFTVDVKADEVGQVLIGLNNSKFYKVDISVREASSDVIKQVTGTETQQIGSTPATYEQATSFVDGTTYYTLAESVYTAASPQPTIDNFGDATYYIVKTAATPIDFTLFKLPVRTSYKPTKTYIITLMGYTKKNSQVPFTYPITMRVINTGATPAAPTTILVENSQGTTSVDETSTVKFTFTTAPTTTSLEYQWEVSTNGTDWNPQGSVLTTYADLTGGVSGNWYRMKVTGKETGVDETTKTFTPVQVE